MAKLIAGHQVRRVRRAAGLNQAMMAEQLGISASYLNLIERNQRPLTAQVLVRLTELFDFDPRSLNAAAPGGGADAIRRRLGDPMFADLEIDRAELEEWLAGAPGGAEAFARVSGARSSAGATTSPISTPQRKRWPTSCGCRPGTCTPRLPSGCG
jgi:XRE family transcriptional regulator, fatty acid utilization regulator